MCDVATEIVLSVWRSYAKDLTETQLERDNYIYAPTLNTNCYFTPIFWVCTFTPTF